MFTSFGILKYFVNIYTYHKIYYVKILLNKSHFSCYNTRMTQIEQTQHAKEFAEYWQDKGDEKQETQRYWIELLQNVLGIENPSRYIEFEKTV